MSGAKNDETEMSQIQIGKTIQKAVRVLEKSA